MPNTGMGELLQEIDHLELSEEELWSMRESINQDALRSLHDDEKANEIWEGIMKDVALDSVAGPFLTSPKTPNRFCTLRTRTHG